MTQIAAAAGLDLSEFAAARLCVVGNVNRDLRLGAIEASDHFFHDGETPTPFIRETLGGGGANSALAATRLGASVTFCAKIGDDGLGSRVARTLSASGVKTHLARDARVATGTSVNLVWTNGHRHFVSAIPNATSMTFDDIDLSAMSRQQHLLRADAWFSEQMLLGGGNRKLFEAAKSAGLAVSLDVNADPFAFDANATQLARRRNALREVLPLVDLVHGNIAELCTFTSTATLEDALQSITRSGAGAVVVHMGAAGAGFFRDGTLIVEPAALLSDAPVNTTGTGDMLSVCMILLHSREDLSVREKLRLANGVVASYMTGQFQLGSELID